MPPMMMLPHIDNIFKPLGADLEDSWKKGLQVPKLLLHAVSIRFTSTPLIIVIETIEYVFQNNPLPSETKRQTRSLVSCKEKVIV